MGGMTLGKSPEQMMRERKALIKDPADIPMEGNRLSPKQQYDAIQQDAKFLSGELPPSGYNRMFPFGSSEKSKRERVAEELRKDSDEGRYAVPGYGDQGQFFGGSSAGGPSRQLGSMVMNEEEEEKKRPPKRYFQKEFAKGGTVSSKASSRADGCAQRGKTKGRFV